AVNAAAPSASAQQPQQAATLIALATTVVLLAIFVILFSYRPRPGGVRASHRYRRRPAGETAPRERVRRSPASQIGSSRYRGFEARILRAKPGWYHDAARPW